jgi:hypothetical protein
MSMTVYDYNFDFQIREDGAQVVVTNNLGRTALFGELVYLGGYFGYVAEFDGIANGATGRIQLLDPSVEISSAQVEVTDTFTAGNILHFLPGGSSSAGTLVDAPATGTIPVGKITGEFGTGGAQTAVIFRPFDLAGSESLPGSPLKVVRADILSTDDFHTTGKVLSIPKGSRIVDVVAIATASNSSGTVQLLNGSSAVHNALATSSDGAVVRMAAGVDDTKLLVGADAISLLTHAAAETSIVYVYYI